MVYNVKDNKCYFNEYDNKINKDDYYKLNLKAYTMFYTSDLNELYLNN